jgi:hypothetical protein
MPVDGTGYQWYLEGHFKFPGAAMSRLLLVLIMVIPMTVAAQIYKSVDENGNTVFSDTPPKDGSSSETVRPGTTNTLAPPPQVQRPQPVVEEKVVELSVEIVSPVPDTTIAIGYVGNFSVTAEIQPSLPGGASAQLLMDGVAVGEPLSAVSWALTNTFRGTHMLTVTISDAQGNQLAESPPVTVHVMRASIAR